MGRVAVKSGLEVPFWLSSFLELCPSIFEGVCDVEEEIVVGLLSAVSPVKTRPNCGTEKLATSFEPLSSFLRFWSPDASLRSSVTWSDFRELVTAFDSCENMQLTSEHCPVPFGQAISLNNPELENMAGG